MKGKIGDGKPQAAEAGVIKHLRLKSVEPRGSRGWRKLVEGE